MLGIPKPAHVQGRQAIDSYCDWRIAMKRSVPEMKVGRRVRFVRGIISVVFK
jgi:hypothetical protein